jgi:hypothetical protein
MSAIFGHVLASVGVFESNDVILAEVAARLHLDDFERDLSGVLQAVFDAERDVGRLVLAEQDDLLAARHPGRAAHHDPVLGAMMVHLQRERGAGADDDALDLEALAAVDAVVPAPGAMHLAMQFGFAAAGGLEAADDGLHFLGALLGRHQHGIGGFDHDHVLAADAGHQPCSAMTRLPVESSHQTSPVTALSSPSWAMACHKRIPGADVRPAGVERHHLRRNAQLRAGRQLFHDGVVDGIGRAGGEGRRIEADEVTVVPGVAHGVRGRRQAFRGRNGRWP